MTQEEIVTRNFIDKIEPKLIVFWEVLSMMKSNNSSTKLAKDMVDFQFELAVCLSEINNEYSKVSKQVKSIKKKHKLLSKQEFEEKKKILQLCLDALRQLIYLVKGLGDAFAWFFYQVERKMLNKHLERQEEFLMPTGALGRAGELEFIRNFKNFDGNIVIYHGITSMLRLRDISLIEVPSMKLTGIGELKTTEKTGNYLTISLHTIGQRDQINDFVKNISINKQDTKNKKNESKVFKERLENQIDDLISAFKGDSKEPLNKNNSDKYIQADTYFKELEKVVNENTKIGTSKYRKAGDGMLFIAVRPEGQKLSDRFFEDSKNDWFNRDEVVNAALSIMDKSCSENSQLLGSIHYGKGGKINFLKGSKPLFWLPVSIDVIKQIYFKEIHVVTVYNPLFLKRRIENIGFKQEYVESLKKKCFVKKNQSSNMVLEHFSYFISIIINHLVDEQAVINSIDTMVRTISNEKLKSNSKINVEFYQM